MLPFADEVRARRTDAILAQRAVQHLGAIEAAIAVIDAHAAAGHLPPDGLPGDALVAELAAAWPTLRELPRAFAVEGALEAVLSGRRTQLEVARNHLAPHGDLPGAFARLNAALTAQQEAMGGESWTDRREELRLRIEARDRAAMRALPHESELVRVDLLQQQVRGWIPALEGEPDPARAAGLARAYATAAAAFLDADGTCDGVAGPPPGASVDAVVAGLRALLDAAVRRRAAVEAALAPELAERDAAQAWLTENMG